MQITLQLKNIYYKDFTLYISQYSLYMHLNVVKQKKHLFEIEETGCCTKK